MIKLHKHTASVDLISERITNSRDNNSCCSSTSAVTRLTAREIERHSGGGKEGFAAAVQIFVIAVT